MKKTLRAEINRTPIIDKTKEKEAILMQAEAEEKRKKEILYSLVHKGHINLTGNINLTQEERSYILSLLAKSRNDVTKDPIFGLNYKITEAPGKCQINSEDGIFYMDAISIEIGGESLG